MKTKLKWMKRPSYASLALAIAAALGLLSLSPSVFAVGGQVQSRSIELSDSTPGATGVTYNVTFTPQTNETNPDVLVDFCSNSPIIGDTCTATAGTDVPDFTGAAASGWTLTTIGTNRGVKLTTTTVSFTAGTPVTITITGVKNPSNTATFYGRILDYATGGAGTNTSDSPGSYVDYGGDALSTASVIGITAKVIESLTFCVSKVAPGTNCSGLTAPTLPLGHASGSTTVLDSTAVDTVPAYTQISSNASHGVAVRMKDTSSTACGGLSDDSGATCGIAAIGATAATITAGQALFGMCVNPGSANTSADAPYNGANCATPGPTTAYGLDQATANNNVLSTYGNQIFHSTSAVNQEADTLNFAGSAALTTPAGIYSGNYALIATGTF